MTGLLFSKQALARFEMIRPHLEDKIPLAHLANDHGKSERTLRRWVLRYLVDGLAGLERKKRDDQGKRRKLSPELVDMIRGYVLQKPVLPISVIHRRIVAYAQAHDLPAPSYAVVYDVAQQIDPALKTLARNGSKIYREQYELIHRHEASHPNDLWQADHALLDILLLTEHGDLARPWLTVILDDYSRALCGYYFSFDDPNAVNTALALRQAIWHKSHPAWSVCGIPQVLYVDNDTDFTSTHLEQACHNLKIRIMHSPPARPQGRGKIERFFQTVNQMLLSELSGYLLDKQLASSPSLSIPNMIGHFEQFIHETYHQRNHGTTRQPPVKRWQDPTFLPQLPDSREALDLLLLRVAKGRKVQRDGIRFQAMRYIEPTLAAFVGEQVEIYFDPRDLAEIQVYHEGVFVCRAICQDIANRTVSLRDIRRARDRQRNALKRQLKPTTNKPTDFDDTPPSSPLSTSRLKRYRDDN